MGHFKFIPPALVSNLSKFSEITTNDFTQDFYHCGSSWPLISKEQMNNSVSLSSKPLF